MYKSMNIQNLSVPERVFEFAVQHLYAGRKPEILLKQFSLTYREGKSEKDVLKAKQLSFSRPRNDMDVVDDFANRLYKNVLKSI